MSDYDIYADQFYDSYYGAPTFEEVYPDFQGFLDDATNEYSMFKCFDDDTTYRTVFYLLYAKFGDRETIQTDLVRWKTKLFSLIWQYGPNWKRELDLQGTLRSLTDTQIEQGSKQIYNRALAPGEVVDVANDALVDTVNEQNTTTAKKGKLEGYAALVSLLDDNITERFLARFQNLFNPFAMNGKITTYPKIF